MQSAITRTALRAHIVALRARGACQSLFADCFAGRWLPPTPESTSTSFPSAGLLAREFARIAAEPAIGLALKWMFPRNERRTEASTTPRMNPLQPLLFSPGHHPLCRRHGVH